MAHEIIPIPGKEYTVNGTKMIVRAVANARKYNNMVASSDGGKFVYLSRRYSTGRIAKGVVRYWNCRNEPSWYDQDVACT